MIRFNVALSAAVCHLTIVVGTIDIGRRASEVWSCANRDLSVSPTHPPLANADSVISAGMFVTRLGADTLAVERFTRTRARLEGEIVRRTPSLVISRYTVLLDGGRPTSLHVMDRAGDGGLLPNRVRTFRATLGADSILGEFQLDTLVRQRRAAVRALPWLLYSWALTELEVEALRAAGEDSAALHVIIATEDGLGAAARPLQTWIRGDEAYQWNLLGAGPTVFALDKDGRIIRVDGTRTTTRFLTERTNGAVDVGAVARRFAEEEAAGRRFGSLNTDRDTTVASVGHARIVVDYSRPRLRGRRVFTNGVLGDTLWRTGANAATQFSTDADLLVGDALVPAGKYTLWTLASKDNRHYTLIINKQTGQWGVPQFNYHAERDLARVTLVARALSQPVEAFTISVERRGGSAGVLKLVWDTTELSVPIILR